MDNIKEILDQTEKYLLELPSSSHLPDIPQGKEVAAYIDHTLLKAEATPAQIEKLCAEASENSFASVCINPVYIPLATKLLIGSTVKVCTVVGFPLGASLKVSKELETLACIFSGANEIDMVLHVGGLKGGAYLSVFDEILGVVQTAHAQQVIVKVILETSILNQAEKITACLLCKNAGADYVKTSTGFGTGGATVADVDLMYRIVSPQVKVKASGGIRSYNDALAMIQAGASRLGTSAGIQIIKDAK
jgi:deoxyribose-phosphate aldolase